MVPTFTTNRIDEGSAQLYPCGIATSTPQAFLVASISAVSTDIRVLMLVHDARRSPAHIRNV